MRGTLAVVLVLATGPAAAGSPVVPDLLGGGRLVAYRAVAGTSPQAVAFRVDARELERRGFRGVSLPVSAAAALACRVFKRAGFRTVVVDVPEPRDRRSVVRAIRMRRCADAYVLGRGGLAAGRYPIAWLEARMAEVRAATGKPVTTREPLVRYEEDPEMLALGDWVFPSADPYLADAKLPQTACGYSVSRYLNLLALVPAGRVVVLGETGLPTAGDRPLSENGQRAFLGCIEPRAVRFEHHTAFDHADDASTPVAAHYGLFRADGTPKLSALAMGPRPRLAMWRRGGRVRGVVGNAPGLYFRVALYAHATDWEPRGMVDIGPRGKWRAAQDADAALVVARAFVPEGGDRLPQVDDRAVFATAPRAR